jgi:hypothetical protein
MLNEDELIKLIVSLPEASGVTLEQLKSGKYEAVVDYPPIELDYPSGEQADIPDDEFFHGNTPIEALVNALLGTCLEWNRMLDGSQGDLFDLIEQFGEGEVYDNDFGKGTMYQTRLALELPLESGPHTIYLTDGRIWYDEKGEVVEEAPPEFYEDQQPE